jgi:N-acetylmuramic acid 6-phosphate etherase
VTRLLEHLTTEQCNAKTKNLDEMTTQEILQVMNEEDQTVAFAVSKQLGQIEKLVQKVIASFQQGGRLIYIGAGTSGRLGMPADVWNRSGNGTRNYCWWIGSVYKRRRRCGR